jgi:hypothetical protein
MKKIALTFSIAAILGIFFGTYIIYLVNKYQKPKITYVI